jgi:hypothetical protein
LFQFLVHGRKGKKCKTMETINVKNVSYVYIVYRMWLKFSKINLPRLCVSIANGYELMIRYCINGCLRQTLNCPISGII